MALIDFYQLAVLHKLSRGDGCVLYEPLNPPPMPATKFPAFPSLPARFHQTARSEPKTPQDKHDVALHVPASTPNATGTAILPKLRADTDETTKYDSDKYEEYIVQDFERHRVFVDIDVFMKDVLHIPEDWKELWNKGITRVKLDQRFEEPALKYTGLCEAPGTLEEAFYKPLVEMVNAILTICESSPKGPRPLTRQRYLRNDPSPVLGGMMNDLRPDVVAVHHDSFLHLDQHDREQAVVGRSNIMWAQPLQVLEVKPWDNALVDGTCMPRLKVDGRDPRDNHAPACTPSRYRKKNSKAASEVPSLKRPAEELPESKRKTAKAGHKSTPGGQPPERKARQPQTNETEQQKDAYLQVGRYLFEQFSIPAFRSHATVCLVDRDRIQFYHANHSVILVSSAINFSQNYQGDGVDKFIAIVIGFSQLSLRDNGILHDLHNGRLFADNKKLVTVGAYREAAQMQEGNKLVLKGGKLKRPVTLTYGEVISHEPSLAGRATAVLEVKSSSLWKDLDLVAKISWPGSNRVAESVFLEKAVETAESSAEDKWALKHLPQVLFAQDVVFGADSTHERVAKLFENPEFVDPRRKLVYERRALRIIVQERLYPLNTLTEVEDIAQVFLDVACVHRWLYLRAGILHRDFSLNNIMYRTIIEENENGDLEEKVYGVLTDFDLASWKEDLDDKYKQTSQQRTGTPPFMAQGLLDGSESLHLYRHDLESLFYVMLIVATRYEIEPTTKKERGGLRARRGLKELPHQDWFDQEYKALANSKSKFFSRPTYLDLSPAFEDFRGWLVDFRRSFLEGFRSKQDYVELHQHKGDGLGGEVVATFDEETLGGHVDYSALIHPVSKLKGKLGELIVRYNPPP